MSGLAQSDTIHSKNNGDPFAQMLDLSRPNGHHLVLGSIAGKWAFQDAKLPFVKGTIIRKPLYDGRFYMVDLVGGKLQVPIADGKMKEDNYRGLQIEGYDNGRSAFVSISINNHIGSDVEMQMGTYDSTSKTFTYFWETELIRGEKKKNKMTLKIINNNQYTEEYYEQQDGQFVKVRELNYTKLAED